MSGSRRSVMAAAPLFIGAALLAFTVTHTGWRGGATLDSRFWLFLPVALLPSAGWHLLRTIAWRLCFPRQAQLSLARVFRVRLAAEAFSFVTIRGVAGEPLKVLLLEPDVAPTVAAAAVALERVAYLLVTAVIVGVAAIAAMITLPLTRAWMNIFGGVAAAAVVMIAAAGVLLARRDGSPRGAASARERHLSLVVGFVRQFDAQLRGLIHGDRRRLVILLVLEALAYVMMALEVWVVLSLTSTPVTLVGAIAVETFTRVASMASTFIPANLGALEASNVAAATAVHAVGGAAALALLRRVRGIVWCAGGFLIYPRRGANARNTATRATPVPVDDRSAVAKGGDGDRTLLVIERPRPAVAISERLGGLPIGERILRAAARAGYTRVLVWTPDQRSGWMAAASRVASLDVAVESDDARWQSMVAHLDPHAPITVVGPAIVPSPSVLEGARRLAPDHGQPVIEVPGHDSAQTGVFRTLPETIARPVIWPGEPGRGGDRAALPAADTRTSWSLGVSTSAELAAAERQLRTAIFKPTDGKLGRFNRRMSIPISVALIRWTRFNAHAMSVVIIGLGLYSGWLFSRGDYISGVLAALVSWAASVLDGCDGELARLQYTDSAFGCWLDTLGDYVYYLAIFIGLTIGAVRQTGSGAFWWVGAAMLTGMLLTFGLLILLRERITGGRLEQLRTTTKAHFYASGKRWARLVARISAVATRATMPYGIVAFAVLGLLPEVLVLGAIGAQIYWISLAVELRRLLLHASPREGGRLLRAS